MVPIMLTVPHYYQERGVPLCSLWCLKMVYEYHGLRRDVPDLMAAVTRIPTGVYIQEVGRHAIEHGFAAVLTAHDTSRLPLSLGGREELAAYFRRRLAEEDLGEKQIAYADGMARFLEAGGELRIQVPTLVDPIRRDLARGAPVICSIDMKALYGGQGEDPDWPPAHRLGQVGHYVVVTGIDDETVTVNDPSPYRGGIVRYAHERFLYALYSYQGYVLSLLPRNSAMI